MLVNEITSSIESNLTIFDLTWNLLFANCVTFETKAIGANMVIHNNVWGYFNTIDLILSIFYGLDIHCYYQYDLHGMITLQLLYCCETRIMILLLLLLSYYFIVISSKRNSHFCVTFVICYDYELIYNVLSNNINNTINEYDLLNESSDNNEWIFYCRCEVWCRIIIANGNCTIHLRYFICFCNWIMRNWMETMEVICVIMMKNKEDKIYNYQYYCIHHWHYTNCWFNNYDCYSDAEFLV